MSAIGTYQTHEFETYAETQEAGALGSKKKYIVVLSDEMNGNVPTQYYFDGENLLKLGGTTASATPPTKEYFTATGGETEIPSSGIQTSTVTMVLQGLTPLEEYTAEDDTVPGGSYKVKTDLILIGDPAGPGEIFTIIKFN